jgi:hypothetical protein
MVLRLRGACTARTRIFFCRNSCLHFSAKLLACSSIVYRGGPLVGVTRKILAAGTKLSKTLMAPPLWGAGGKSGSGHHRSWKHRWRAPWGVLAAGLTAATTGVGDVNGGPPGGCWRQVRQRPPPELETSMAPPLRLWCYEVSSAKGKDVCSKVTPRGAGPELPLLAPSHRSHS